MRVNGPTSPDLRLPNTLSISIEGFVASDALRALADRLAASAGAACHSSGGASGVLRAIGLEVSRHRGDGGERNCRAGGEQHTCQRQVREWETAVYEGVRCCRAVGSRGGSEGGVL